LLAGSWRTLVQLSRFSFSVKWHHREWYEACCSQSLGSCCSSAVQAALAVVLVGAVSVAFIMTRVFVVLSHACMGPRMHPACQQGAPCQLVSNRQCLTSTL
jgi:hypothetical protein